MAVATGTALLATAGATAGAAALDAKSQRDAAKSAQNQRRESQDFIERMTKQARNDIFKLFPAAQESRQKGVQAGLDLYGMSIPAQMQTFRRGNVAAQDFLSQGLPQMTNAILGNPVNTNFAPRNIQVGDLGLQMPSAPQVNPIADTSQGLNAPNMYNPRMWTY